MDSSSGQSIEGVIHGGIIYGGGGTIHCGLNINIGNCSKSTIMVWEFFFSPKGKNITNSILTNNDTFKECFQLHAMV